MFGNSVSPSWTYMVILFKNSEEGHKIQKFTLPSNQEEFKNDNLNAYRYFLQYLLQDLRYTILGVISVEDYLNTERVGIPLALARKFAFEREQKEAKKPHAFYSKEFFKLLEDADEESLTIDQLREHVFTTAIRPSARKRPIFNFTMDKSSAGDAVLINFTKPSEASEFMLSIRKRYKEDGNVSLGTIFYYLGISAKIEDIDYRWYSLEGMDIFNRMGPNGDQIYSIMFPSDIHFKNSWEEKAK